MKKILSFLLAIAVTCSFVAAIPQSAKALDESTIKTKKGTQTIGVGEQLQLMALYAKRYNDPDPVWISDNESVVTVSQAGKITGVNVGTATVQMMYKGVPKATTETTVAPLPETSTEHAMGYRPIPEFEPPEHDVILYSYKVTVKDAPSKIKLNKTSVSCFAKDKFTLKPSIRKKQYCNGYTFKSSNKKIATVSKKGVVKAEKKGTATITVKAYNDVTATCKIKVKSSDKIVALTFDDGPSADTAKLLKTLKKYDCHATFFMVGVQVPGKEKIVKQMVKDGHEIGTHTLDHPQMSSLSKSEQKAKLTKSMKIIKKACGKHPTIFRPPYGAYNDDTLAVAKNLKMPVALWNSNIEDYKTTSSSVVKNNIQKIAKDGIIYVIHDSHSWSVEGICQAIPEMKKQGYEFVSLSEYAKIKKKPLKAGKIYRGK